MCLLKTKENKITNKSIPYYYRILIEDAIKKNDHEKRKYYVVKKFIHTHQKDKEQADLRNYIKDMIEENPKLRDRNKILELENELLKTELKYRPSGEGMKECENNFYLIDEKLNNIKLKGE